MLRQFGNAAKSQAIAHHSDPRKLLSLSASGARAFNTRTIGGLRTSTKEEGEANMKIGR